MKTVAVDTVDRVLVVVHGKGAPTDPDWQVYLNAAMQMRTLKGILVWSYGGGPDAKQRKRALEVVKTAVGRSTPPPTAVLSDSPLVRMMVTGANWFFPGALRPFATGELDRALQFLGLEDAEPIASIRVALDRLKTEVIA